MSARTSSTRPASRICATRRPIRSASTARGSQTPAIRTGNTGRPNSWRPVPNDENGRPVMLDHLERTGDPTGVAGLDAGRGRGITAHELGVGGGEPGGRPGPGEDLVAHRAVLGRERERVDHGLQVQAGAAHEQRPLPSALDVGDRGAGLGLEARHRPLLVGVGHVDQVVRDLGALGRPPAWRCRCRGRGRPASSRSTRSRRRRTHAPPRARAPTSRKRWGRRSRGAVPVTTGAAVTGMRTRAGRGAACTATRSPRSQCGAA